MWTWMRHTARGALGIALVLSGCSSGEETPQPPAAAGWAGAPSADLAPTGLVLAGAPTTGDEEGRVSGMVVDGAGSAWLPGPWQLTRLDPVTGDATTWDAVDDWAFAGGPLLVPSAGSGVWLVAGDRARLFDGTRFAADLTFPEEMLRPDDGDTGTEDDSDVSTSVVSGVEVGSALWLSVTHHDNQDWSSDARVLRWSDGQWTVMADHGSGVGGALALDAQGGIWAGGVADPPEVVGTGVRRWDGSQWATPETPETPGAIRAGGYVVPDPSDGVWVLGHPQDEEPGGDPTAPVALARLIGGSWQVVDPDVVAGIGQPVAVRSHGQGLGVASDGALWVSGANGVAEYRPEGIVRTFGPDQGVPTSATDPPVVAVAGDESTVLARTQAGVVGLDGDTFEPLWSDAIWSTESSGQLVAASAGEVWSLAPRPGAELEQTPSLGDPWTGPPLGWSRFSDGRWTPVGPPVYWGGRPAALATDGAVWALTSAGLTRISGGEWSAVAPDLIDWPDDGMFWNDPQVVAGPDGLVWTNGQDGTIVGVGAEGARNEIGTPPGLDLAVPRAAGTDGTVWVVAADPSSEVPSLRRWDGAWATVAVPEDVSEVGEMVVAGDGALWAALGRGSGGSALGRYADGAWTVFPEPAAHTLAAAPGSVVCTGMPVASPIRCYDASGLVGTVAFDGWYDDFDVAPDGAVWVCGEQIARLPDSAPQR
ncbi:MAG TPA: hypothetical protein VES03_00185 [Motilibacterales bacterium]|nr:hypothetical protein [Motilibacterales bacterium]